MAKEATKVKARVVRGQFAERGEDGDVRYVKATDPEPFVQVTEAQLKSFVGVLVKAGSEEESTAVSETEAERSGATVDQEALGENAAARSRRR